MDLFFLSKKLIPVFPGPKLLAPLKNYVYRRALHPTAPRGRCLRNGETTSRQFENSQRLSEWLNKASERDVAFIEWNIDETEKMFQNNLYMDMDKSDVKSNYSNYLLPKILICLLQAKRPNTCIKKMTLPGLLQQSH